MFYYYYPILVFESKPPDVNGLISAKHGETARNDFPNLMLNI